jgi:hypothetical protein
MYRMVTTNGKQKSGGTGNECIRLPIFTDLKYLFLENMNVRRKAQMPIRRLV